MNEENKSDYSDNEEILFDKFKIKTNEDPFRNAPFKKKTSASSSLTTSSNSVKINPSAALNSNEQLHKSAFQPYKRPDDPFTSAPFEMNSNKKKINPFYNVPFNSYEMEKKQQQNQFDYSKFGHKKKSKKSSNDEETAAMEDNQTVKNIKMISKNENKEKITSLTQSQSLNSITTTANVNAASIMSIMTPNSTNASSSNCTGKF
jgi:hypothetical protein